MDLDKTGIFDLPSFVYPDQADFLSLRIALVRGIFNASSTIFDDLHYATLSVSDSMKRLAYEEAIKQYQEMVDNYPESEWAPQAMYRIGECHLRIEEYLKAKEACEKLMRKYPESPLAANSCEGEGIIRQSGQRISLKSGNEGIWWCLCRRRGILSSMEE